MSQIADKALLPLKKFLQAYSKIIELRSKIVDVGQSVLSIQLNWRGNQRIRQNVCSALKQLFMREREAMVLYLINTKSKRN